MGTVQIAFWVPDWIAELVENLHVAANPKTNQNHTKEIFLKGVCAELDIQGDAENRKRVEKYLDSL